MSYIARLAYDILYGIPSIVYGAFAFTIMVMVGMRASVLGGILVTTMLIIPIMIHFISCSESTRLRHAIFLHIQSDGASFLHRHALRIRDRRRIHQRPELHLRIIGHDRTRITEGSEVL